MFFGRSVVQLGIIVYPNGQPSGYKIMWGRYYNNSYTLYEQLDVCTREPCYWSLLFCTYCFICFTLTHEFVKNLYLPVLWQYCFFFWCHAIWVFIHLHKTDNGTNLIASSILASVLYLTPACSFVHASFCGENHHQWQ